MTQLDLWFSTDKQPSLQQTYFKPFKIEGSAKFHAVQGRMGLTSDSESTNGTFSWSKAVRAMALLFVEHRLRAIQLNEQRVRGFLVGTAGSPAASLDYALSKKPAWLLDMFGLSEKGESYALRVFQRINPERKRPGPVRVHINPAFLPTDELRIFVGGKLYDTEELLLEFLSTLKTSILPDFESGKLKESLFSNKEQDKPVVDPTEIGFIERFVRTEIRETLSSVDIFTSRGYQRHISSMVQNPSLRYFCGKAALRLREMVRPLSSDERLGVAVKSAEILLPLRSRTKLRVSLTLGEVASQAIFAYLNDILKLGIEVTSNNPHSLRSYSKVAQSSSLEQPDFCTLAIGGVAKALAMGKQFNYVPLMLMPSGAFRIVSTDVERKKNKPSGLLLTHQEENSTSQFYLHELQQQQSLKSSTFTEEHMEADEMFQAINDDPKGVNALLYFPHYRFNEVFNAAKSYSFGNETLGFKENVLFVHRSLAQELSLLKSVEVCIRDAWLRLKEDATLRERMARKILENVEFQRAMLRYSGLTGSGDRELFFPTPESKLANDFNN